MKATILNYTGDRANWGCQATSIEFEKEILGVLSAAGLGKVEFMRVPLLPTRLIDRLAHLVFGRYIRHCLNRANLGYVRGKALLAISWLLYRPYIHGIRESDIVFFQAEGTMGGKIGVFSSGLRLLLLPYVSRVIFKKPVFALNQTILSEDPAFTAILRNCFALFDVVAVREPESQRHARQLGLEEVLMIPDSAFSSVPSDESLDDLLLPAQGKEFFCVTGSAIIDRVDIEKYLEAIRVAAADSGLTVALLCSTDADLAFARKAERSLAGVPLFRIPASIGYRKAAAVIARGKFLLGGRYHLAILAAATHTPFVLMSSNSHKSDGLVELLDYPLPVIPFDDLAGMSDNIRRVLADHSNITELLVRKVQEVQARRSSGAVVVRQALARLCA